MRRLVLWWHERVLRHDVRHAYTYYPAQHTHEAACTTCGVYLGKWHLG